MTGRIISAAIAVFYLVTAYLADGAEAMWYAAAYLILPLACIWFSTAMGGYTGINFGTRPAITRTTPGCFVAFFGWLLLLMPVILGVIMALRESS